MLKVFLTDDHALLREGLKRLLEKDHELVVAGESGKGQETLRWLGRNPCDLLILNLNLPDIDGLQVLQQVRQRHPNLPVLILTMYMDNTMATRLLKAGAAGYVTKTAPTEVIVAAIRRVAKGGHYLDPDLAADMAEKISTGSPPLPHEQLSNREFTVLLKISSGYSISEIASMLHLAPSTVSTYRTRVLEKMNKTSNAELVRYVIDHQLL
ncbi:MAG: response regulator transcription factor [Magnetococcales bacterium]|nr:response regulator transcription factor [Magnetococcales bacterium]